MSNLDVWQLLSAFWSELVLPAGSTHSNSHRREYLLTADAIHNQLPSRNTVSSGLDGWTCTNKLPITSVIVYDINQIMALWKVQLAFDEVDSIFFSNFEI